ncbi:MAG: RagB/SusD family nutrient uptake outer membrane protein [Bacteroidota bacterium]|nr:RagB/SusD family nutrient uptake outer membrane protein [Bacteroidota bacterium]
MKKIVNILSLFIVGLLFFSCEGDLEPVIYDRVAPSNFYKTADDLNAATTSIYWDLKENGWGPYMVSDGSRFIMNEVGTEEWTTKWSWDAFVNLNWIIGEKMAYGFYGSMMTAVTKATYVIEKIKESPVEESIKSRYIAELRCLRGYFAADLYMLYGPLPIVVTKNEAFYPSSTYKPSRPTKEWMSSYVEKELTDCSKDLPIQQSEWGRCTRGAALAKLLKFYMYENKWQKADSVATAIMGLGYKLQSNYADIFTVANEKNSEIIFALPCEPKDQFGLLWFSNALPPDFKSNVGVNYTAWNGWRVPWAFYDSFELGDKRKNLIYESYTSKTGQIVNLRTAGDVGGLAMKYGEDPNNPGQWAGNDYIQFRYADILLCKAEALNEINPTPTQEIIDLLNDVRRRDFTNYDNSAHFLKLTQFPTKEVMRDRILLERSWELWFEGVRREDLLRHGKYLDVAKKVGATFVSDKNLLFPIPSYALNENPNLVQNPGYND